VGSQQRMLMLLGGIGVLFLAFVIAFAVLSKPFGEETDVSGDPSQPEHSQPAPAAKKPPLN
jgi:hypothetical protein